MNARIRRRRKTAIGAAILAPLVLLGARRAVRAAALRGNEYRRAPLAHGRGTTVRPAAGGVGAAPAGVEGGLPVQSGATRPVEPSSAEQPKRKRRRRLVLAVASVAVIGAFIQHAQSQVPRPTLERPTSVSPAAQARPGSHDVPKSPDALAPPWTRSGVSAPAPASAAPASRRSGTRTSRQTLRQHHPKHQSHTRQSSAGRSSGRRPAKPVLPAKHARERQAPPVRADGGQALHRLRWNAVAGATYYNLVLWRDGKRVLDLWPTSPRVVVPSTSVKHGPQARLSPGRYLWFVYPGFGAKPARQYGALAGSGVLVVQPKGGNEG
jgi:hypothetical protein